MASDTISEYQYLFCLFLSVNSQPLKQFWTPIVIYRWNPPYPHRKGFFSTFDIDTYTTWPNRVRVWPFPYQLGSLRLYPSRQTFLISFALICTLWFFCPTVFVNSRCLPWLCSADELSSALVQLLTHSSCSSPAAEDSAICYKQFFQQYVSL